MCVGVPENAYVMGTLLEEFFLCPKEVASTSGVFEVVEDGILYVQEIGPENRGRRRSCTTKKECQNLTTNP